MTSNVTHIIVFGTAHIHTLSYRDLEFDTDIMATERVEVEMMRKENEALKGERAELVKDRQKIQEDKEALER